MPFTFDDHKNLAIGQISSAPVPAISGTSITLRAGQGALFPTAPFNCTVWPPSVSPLQSNAEIVRVTAVVGDILTITRAQEGTTAKAIAVNWQVSNSVTVKAFTDLQTAVNSVVQSISAGTQSGFGPQIVFANSNNITFGMSGSSQITASFSGGGISGVNFSAGTQSSNLSAIEFADSNNVSFGLDNGTLTAAFYQGAQTEIWLSAGTNSQSTGTVIFSNSNGVSFGLNTNGVMTASAAGAAQTTQPVAASASNGSFLFSTLGFSNGNGVTFGTSAGSIISASVSQTVQPVAASASNGSFLFSTLGFSNANGVTFGTSAGSIITASIGTGAGTASVNFSAGTTSNNIGNIVFSNSNGVSFGLNGSTITASVSTSAAAAVAPANFFEYPVYNYNSFQANTLTAGTLSFNYIDVPKRFSYQSIVGMASWSGFVVSSNASATGQIGYTQSMAMYSRSVTDSAATNFSNSNLWVTSWTASASTTGFASISSQSISASFGWQTNSTGGSSSTSFSTNDTRLNYFQLTRFGLQPFARNDSVPTGDFVMGCIWNSSTAGMASASSLLRLTLMQPVVQTNVAIVTNIFATTSAGAGAAPFFGVYSTSTTGFPSSFQSSDLNYVYSRNRFYFTQ